MEASTQYAGVVRSCAIIEVDGVFIQCNPGSVGKTLSSFLPG